VRAGRTGTTATLRDVLPVGERGVPAGGSSAERCAGAGPLVSHTPPVIEVRLASDSDGPVLAQIDLATWTPVVSPAPPPADPVAYRFFNDRTVPSNLLVAELDDHLAGWVKVQSPTSMPSHAHVLEIGGLAVDPVRQAAGVGRRLVEAAVQECRRRGARKVTLRVLGPNTAARRLYDRCGSRSRVCFGRNSCSRIATSTTSSWLASSWCRSRDRFGYRA
jgi:GNAT superfamily N-acetyltransferase